MTLFDEIRFFITALERAIAAGTPPAEWKQRVEKLYKEGQMSKKALDVVLVVAKEFEPKEPLKRTPPPAAKKPTPAPKPTISGGCGSKIVGSCGSSVSTVSDPCSRGSRRTFGGC